MVERALWQQITPHEFSLDHSGGQLELRYEAAGFQSRWAVLFNGNVLEYCADYIIARGVAMAFAADHARRDALRKVA
jgi:hypothetical protein